MSNQVQSATSTPQPFVLFPLGKKRFALPAGAVTELARPDRLQPFPHTTPLLTGVLIRRGRIVPVLDVAQVLAASEAPARKFYLIANRKFGNSTEWAAIPVTGECILTNAAPVPPTENLPAYVTSLLPLENEILQVIDLERLAEEAGA
jgi:chemotaxis signal transduction protein